MLPQIIIISLSLANLFYVAFLHGKPKEGKHDFWVLLIANMITYSLLYWAGLFDGFKIVINR